MKEEPKLLYLLAILGYQLVLWLSPVQAAGKQEPYTQTWMIGAYRLQMSAASMPRAWQRQALSISVQGTGVRSGRLSALIMPAPATGAAQDATRIPPAVLCEPRGRRELVIRLLPPGLWLLRLVVQAGPQAAGGTLPLRIADPPAPPS